MNKIKTKLENSICLLVFCLTICACNTTTTSKSTYLNKNSKLPPFGMSYCYTKHIRQDKTNTNEYPVFEGIASNENEYIESKTFVLYPAVSKWVKKIKAGCIPTSTYDCSMACLEETAAQTRIILVVKDTVNFKDFKLEKIDQNILSEVESFDGWLEVLCQTQLTSSFIMKLQTALKEQELYDGPLSGKLSNDIMVSLKTYQTANNLTLGYFDIESMKKLNLL